MKRSKRLYAVPFLVLMCYLVIPLSVSATTFETGNAVQDILMDGRFAGAMTSIEWLTKVIDMWFIRIITVTSFFIISMSLLKNVLAAAYCAFPVAFNRIHEAHEQMKWSETAIGKPQELLNNIQNGKISDVILSLIPDIKALTDFVDQEISPKAYFMKAIPQMCVMVIIGIFIYNGYYRDVSATVGEAGATIVENVLGSVSPEKAVNDLFNMKTDPHNTYEKDTTVAGKMIKTLSNEMYKTVKNYSNIYKESKENKEAVMRQSEKWAYNMVMNVDLPNKPSQITADGDGASPFRGTQQYDLKLSNVKVQLLDHNQLTDQYITTDTTDGSKAFRYHISMADWWNGSPLADSEANLKNKTLVITGNLTPVEKSGQTFETKVEAVSGSIDSATLGFSQITISTSEAVLKSRDSGYNASNNQAQFRVTALTEEITTEVNKQIQANCPSGVTRTVMSIVPTNTQDAGQRVTANKGVATVVCNIKIVYSQTESSAGETSQAATGSEEVPLIINLN